MAEQYQIRFDVYDEFETVLSGVVDSLNITDTMPPSREDLPAVVHTYSVSELDMNRNMAAPTSVERDVDGNATAQRHTQLHRGAFEITVAAESKQQASDVHRTLKNHFQKYTKQAFDESEINDDAFNVEVSDSNEVNIPDRFPKIYAHEFTLNVDFKRFEDKTVDPITKIGEYNVTLLAWGDESWGSGLWGNDEITYAED